MNEFINNLKSKKINYVKEDNFKIKKEFLNKIKLNYYKELKNYSVKILNKTELEGYASGIVVSEKNYPFLSLFSVSNSDIENNYLNSSKIVKKDYNTILKLKFKNVLGITSNLNIRKINDNILKQISDIYKSKKIVQFNSKFDKELKFNKIILNKTIGIIGSKNNLKKIELFENTSTSKQIEKYVNEDIKSNRAIIELYSKGINEHQIINLLSIGSFGINSNKKIIPTKWAISIFDRTIENYLFKKIQNYKLIENIEMFKYFDKGNLFLIILFPNQVSGEIIEIQEKFKGKDYFNYQNKLDKSKPNISGAYYSTKISIFEYLENKKRQASILSIRLISGYELPLGVIFVRESVRQTMKNQLNLFSNYAEFEKFLFENYKIILEEYYNSKIYKNIKNQKNLNKYIKD